MNKTIGILRKSNHQNHVEATPDLLVFGYQSKLYRDDVKALELDREAHLIPAPYERKDLISRYDVRATLESAPSETHSYMNRLNFLSPAEQQAETMAEKERYYSLYNNEVEEELYKEELMKRQQADYNQVVFCYDEIGPKESAAVPPEPDDNDTTPFTPSVKLDLPVDMDLPPTVKLNQIIEKTAKFISSQGLQMEILLKTKQAANPQFNFLNHDGQFNGYYKHILGMMKAGTYPWQESPDKNEDSHEFLSNAEAENIAQPPTTPSIVIPKMTFKPSADCAYTQLISKITKAPIAEIEKQKLQETEKLKNGATSAPEVVRKTGLLLVHYSSDSESEEDETKPFTGLLPPSDLQLVIDKTAIYVAKNGVEFEETLRKKQDERFRFLDVSNEFHQYYVWKVNDSRGPAQPAPILRRPKEEVNVPNPPPAPICFSIKPKEEKSPLKPTVLQTNSDDETRDKTDVNVPPAPTPPRMTSIEEELELQYDAMNAEREEKVAKTKLGEKLLSAARERLGMLPKEKMLQIERKKKALLFINQIKGSNGTSSKNGSGTVEDEVINLTHCADDSDDSVKSIPISTATPSAAVKSRSRSRKRSSPSTSSSSSSRSRSSGRSHKRQKTKKSKSHRSKKKYRRKSRSRSRSYKRDRHERRY